MANLNHRTWTLCSFAFLLLAGCATAPKGSTVSSSVPFEYFEKTFIVVPVTIDDSIQTKFILDTGIGINLISKSLCEKLACKVSGSHTGKRMSGQEVTIPMSSVPALSVASLRQTDVPVGVFDIEKLLPDAHIGGFLSLGIFTSSAFSIDYRRQVLSIESADSLKQIKAGGTTVPIKLDIQGASVGVFMPVVLPNGQTVSAEVDTGSQALILDERFMKPLDISAKSPNVRKRHGKDETGHAHTRYFSKLDKGIHLPGAPQMVVAPMEVMFQKIIYEGLVGHYFLEPFTVTYNLPESQMVFRKP